LRRNEYSFGIASILFFVSAFSYCVVYFIVLHFVTATRVPVPYRSDSFDCIHSDVIVS
jgi:hypothetical protein